MKLSHPHADHINDVLMIDVNHFSALFSFCIIMVKHHWNTFLSQEVMTDFGKL